MKTTKPQQTNPKFEYVKTVFQFPIKNKEIKIATISLTSENYSVFTFLN